jgi:hypothetical protein
MTHSAQKGFGMTKHGRSGHATRSPRFRFSQKLETQKNDRRDALGSRILSSPSKSFFIPGSQHEPNCDRKVHPPLNTLNPNMSHDEIIVGQRIALSSCSWTSMAS